MDNKKNIEELREKYPGFFESFPLELIEFALSEKTAQKIANICIENKITSQEEVVGIAFRITYTLFGKIPKEGLAITFKEGLGIEEEKAEKIAKSAEEIILSGIPESKSEAESPTEEETEKKEAPPTTPLKKDEDDAYREPIE